MFSEALRGVAKGRKAHRHSQVSDNNTIHDLRQSCSQKFLYRQMCLAAMAKRYSGAQNAIRDLLHPASTMRAISTESCSVRAL